MLKCGRVVLVCGFLSLFGSCRWPRSASAPRLGGTFIRHPRSTEKGDASSRKSPLKDAAHATLAAQPIRPVSRPDGFVCLTNWQVNPACKDYGAGQGPGPGVKSKNPETVPENSDEVVVPVVLTTTTKSECAGTVNEYDAFGIVVPKPTTPLSPR